MDKEQKKYDIFISYRREGGDKYARTIQQALEKQYRVFLDFDELKDGTKELADGMEELYDGSVELYDGRTFEGAIVGADSETDVALIKIEALGFQAATLSRSKLKNAQTVYVMGHPDSNLKYTMTSGIVSGQGREVDFSDGIQLNMFQIDAAINPGNSGGPV